METVILPHMQLTCPDRQKSRKTGPEEKSSDRVSRKKEKKKQLIQSSIQFSA